ncbi:MULTISPECIES: response regulator [Thermodesulfobacterium]|nr:MULTISPECIES: response regulator [Thermodesulfobacterium]KUK18912.1 MAG: Response regulator receiver protein [Thermodesulfobacterium commune]KUK37564.1 MAG: Response regulator receiver protein [Thermodesulfobacterium commune]MBZ4681672.1 histidine kinase [Thermodesulfobacterium sp.]MDN5379658.1 two-component system, chemotaxis family, chemotaxis protein CheY [Thermodesulfobacterium sp.]
MIRMKKAMVVDDSSAIRQIERKYLEEMGFEVLEAENGEEALKVLNEHPDVQLILLDWHMPVMNGYEFLLKLRANPKWSDIKVMMVTTENQQKSVIDAILAGANEYLMKPFDKEMLETKIKFLLEGF